jgi:hypothetical protein
MTTTNDTAGPVRLDEWERHAAAGRLDEAVVAYVRRFDWETFVELQRHFGGYLNVEGDVCLTPSPRHPNLILWAGMSQEFASLLLGLLDAKRLHVHGASLFSYMIDGGMLRMPLAKSARAYKKPHWLPACLRVVPLPPKGRATAVPSAAGSCNGATAAATAPHGPRP